MLLSRLTDDFLTRSPDIDETPQADEKAAQLVDRLSRQKARAAMSAFPDALIIGSDQVAALGDRIFGKPGGFERACEQLMMCAGREVIFHAGLCVLDARDGAEQFVNVPTRVVFRSFSAGEAKAYLHRDAPWECAGSFRSESLGIALCSCIESADPSALIGLPLIELRRMLANAGRELL